MPAMPKPEPPKRRKSMYETVMEQMETIEERAPVNIRRIKRTIGLYERIYGMSSDEMRRKVAAGEMEETNDICSWSEHLDLIARIHPRGEQGAR